MKRNIKKQTGNNREIQKKMRKKEKKLKHKDKYYL